MVDVHPVAALLTDEMRARVAAATFVPNDDPDSEWIAGTIAVVDGRECCPMGVALGILHYEFPTADEVADILCTHAPDAYKALEDFIDAVDGGKVAPEDVKPMLGVEP